MLENDIHSTYLFELGENSNSLLGSLEVEINGTADPLIQKVDWTYSIVAEDIEYLSEGDTFEENYTIQLNENFVNFVKDDVAQLDIHVEVVGTNDQPEIVFEALDDINVVLREGKNDTASGQLQISERDINDRIFYL